MCGRSVGWYTHRYAWARQFRLVIIDNLNIHRTRIGPHKADAICDARILILPVAQAAVQENHEDAFQRLHVFERILVQQHHVCIFPDFQ